MDLRAAVGVAAVAHASILVVLGSRPPPVHLAIASVRERVLESVLEIEAPEDDVAAAAPSHEVASTASLPDRRGASTPGGLFSPVAGRGAGTVGGATGEGAAIADAEPSAPSTWSFSPIASGTQDLSVPKAWAYRAPELAPPEPPPAHRSVLRGRDAHDRALGLGPEGPLVAVVHAAGRASLIPVSSSGRLVVTVDADGRVRHVSLTGTGDAAAWRALRDEIEREMQAKRLRVPSGGAGLRVTCDVVSRLRSASGHDRGSTARIGGDDVSCPQGGCVISGKNDPSDLLLDAVAPDVRTVEVRTVDVERL